MSVVRRTKKVFTVEFTTFVVFADSKLEALEIVKQYVTKQCKNLEGFFNMRAEVTEKEIFADIKGNK